MQSDKSRALRAHSAVPREQEERRRCYRFARASKGLIETVLRDSLKSAFKSAASRLLLLLLHYENHHHHDLWFGSLLFRFPTCRHRVPLRLRRLRPRLFKTKSNSRPLLTRGDDDGHHHHDVVLLRGSAVLRPLSSEGGVVTLTALTRHASNTSGWSIIAAPPPTLSICSSILLNYGIPVPSGENVALSRLYYCFSWF